MSWGGKRREKFLPRVSKNSKKRGSSFSVAGPKKRGRKNSAQPVFGRKKKGGGQQPPPRVVRHGGAERSPADCWKGKKGTFKRSNKKKKEKPGHSEEKPEAVRGRSLSKGGKEGNSYQFWKKKRGGKGVVEERRPAL